MAAASQAHGDVRQPVALAALVLLVVSLRPSAAAPDIFVGDRPVEVTIVAPFRKLFVNAEADPEASVSGSLIIRTEPGAPDTTIRNVTIKERGNTSRRSTECTFPKLSLDLDDANGTGAPVGDIRVLKIGTHCGDAPIGVLTPKFGRLANELAPVREALVYRLLEAAGVPTLRARPARITYRFVGAQTDASLTRNAMLLEDDDDAARRFGGTQIDEAGFVSAREHFQVTDTARLAFAQAMVGNFDWCLRMFRGDIYRCDDRHPLWNVLAFDRTDGPDLPLPYDFDLAGPVVGRHIWFDEVFAADFAASGSPIEVEVLAQVQRTRSLFDRSVLDATRAWFVDARPRVEAALAQATVDDEGRRLARRYVDAFYQGITRDERFYGPIVVEGGHRAFLDAEGVQPACGDRSHVPQGTVVSAPLATRDGRVQVRVLDALWTWTGDRRCEAVQREPVWIDSNAIGTDYPR